MYKACIKYGYYFVDGGAVSNRDLWTGRIHLHERGKTATVKNWVSNSDSKKQELLGKGKNFAYSLNSCTKKVSSECFADENKSCKKSNRTINDVSLDSLSKIKNLGSEVFCGNIFLEKNILWKFGCGCIAPQIFGKIIYKTQLSMRLTNTGLVSSRVSLTL